MALGIDVSIYAKTELLLSPQGARIVAISHRLMMQHHVTVPARGANCSAMNASNASCHLLQSPQGARIVALLKVLIVLTVVTVPARGANCSKMEDHEMRPYQLQSPQGARIVATIMPECSAKGIYFPVIFTRFSISYFIL